MKTPRRKPTQNMLLIANVLRERGPMRGYVVAHHLPDFHGAVLASVLRAMEVRGMVELRDDKYHLIE